MKTRQFIPFVSTLIVIGACAKSPLPVGASYQSLTGEDQITVLSKTTVDVTSEGQTYQGQYSLLDDGRVRIVVGVLGTEAVLYFTIADQGLQQVNAQGEPEGEFVYASEHVVSARDERYCPPVKEKSEAFTTAQFVRFSRSKTYATDEDSAYRVKYLQEPFQRKIMGIPGYYFATAYSHPRCSQSYFYRNSPGTEEALGFIDAAAAESTWSEWERDLEAHKKEWAERQGR